MNISGKKIAVTVNGVSIVSGALGVNGGTNSWTFRGSADKLDSSVGEKRGYRGTATGLRGGQVSMTILADISIGVTIQEADILTNWRGFYDVDDVLEAVSCPLLVVLEAERGGEVGGRIEWKIQAETDAVYTVNK